MLRWAFKLQLALVWTGWRIPQSTSGPRHAPGINVTPRPFYAWRSGRDISLGSLLSLKKNTPATVGLGLPATTKTVCSPPGARRAVSARRAMGVISHTKMVAAIAFTIVRIHHCPGRDSLVVRVGTHSARITSKRGSSPSAMAKELAKMSRFV